MIRQTRAGPTRSFLFLQGLEGWYFNDLAQELLRRGHHVHRINFNGGDQLFWRASKAEAYRGRLIGWAAVLSGRLKAWGTTDIIMFGERRPLHVLAAEVGLEQGVRVHVVDEGYLRPNWISFFEPADRDNALGRAVEWYEEAAHDCPTWSGGEQIDSSFAKRAGESVLYNLGTLLLSPFYPGYRTHRTRSAVTEGVGWIKKLALSGHESRISNASVTSILREGGPYWLFPLQLESDYQIREKSPFPDMASAIDVVVGSFSRYARPDARLVIKEHPLDNRIWSLRDAARAISKTHGVQDRIAYVTKTDLHPLVQSALGMITINSTAAVVALRLGVPIVVLGQAIYDMEGLTFQGGLDRFWSEGEPPSAEAVQAFQRVVASRTQVNGGFFSKAALARAVTGAADRLSA